MTLKLFRVDNDEEFNEVFKVFDGGGNGFISANELKTILTTLGKKTTDDEVHTMLLEADTDGDDQVSYEGTTVI